MLCCETRSSYVRRHNDLEGHSNFSSTIYSSSILCLEHHYCGDHQWQFTYLKVKSDKCLCLLLALKNLVLFTSLLYPWPLIFRLWVPQNNGKFGRVIVANNADTVEFLGASSYCAIKFLAAKNLAANGVSRKFAADFQLLKIRRGIRITAAARASNWVTFM